MFLKKAISLLFVISIAISLTSFLPILPANAQSGSGALIEIKNRLEPIGRKYGQPGLLEQGDTQAALIDRTAAIIAIFLGFLAIVFIVLILYGGWLWMSARGNDEQVKKAQSVIKNAVLGVFVIIISYAFTAFVLTKLKEATMG